LMAAAMLRIISRRSGLSSHSAALASSGSCNRKLVDFFTDS
jgi:hypothetical protein